jgi:GTP-binding protein
MPPTVVILGRPNAGKSTLFNRLAGKQFALVHDEPGVTRDWREGLAQLGDLEFRLIDTAGFEEHPGDGFRAAMRRMTERAIAEADLGLFLIDARAGVTADDRDFAELVRRLGKPVILVANKAEGRAGEAGRLEAYSLGLGEPIALSAAHGEGLDELYEALKERLPGAVSPAPDELEPQRPLNLAVIGRPNAGKSTLVNALLGRERVITGPEPGITRDAIGIEWSYKGRDIRLWDTAGMRRKSKVISTLERLAVADGLRAARFAEVVILLIDAGQPFEKQDLQLADLVEREGRALVIAVNKWDRVEDKASRLKLLKEEAERLLPQLAGVPIVTVSALRRTGLDRLMAACFQVHEVWNRRVATPRLNRWLAHQVDRHPPPAPGGRRLKLKFLTQTGVRPPTFALFLSRAKELPEAYKRYLINGLRSDFGFAGVPMRLNLRERENPYEPAGRRP